MLKKNQAVFKTGNILSDLLIILLSCYFAWQFRFNVLDGVNNIGTSRTRLILLVIMFSMLNVFTLYLMNVYSPQRLRKVGQNTWRIFAGNGLCSLLLMAALYIFKFIDVPRLLIGFGWVISSVLVSLKHILVVILLRTLRNKGYNLRHYVVVGNGNLAHQYVENVRANPYTGVAVDGYFSAVQRPELGRCLGTYEQLGEILAKNDYDGIVVALEPHEVQYMRGILDVANREGIQIDLIPFFNDYYPTHPTFDILGSSRLVDLRSTPLNYVGNAFAKRSFDLLFSLFFLIVFSPLMLLVAVGVKLSSPGPVIFKQERIGRDRKPFVMYKFRSMRVSGTEDTGWSQNEDPRKTKFGSLIRKFSIDEFPQFFNVLKGDMSVIGPRPEIPYHVDHFKNEIPRYLVRQQVRPGITGLAQVNGYRGDTSVEDRVRCDIEYIENWSIGLDVRIFWKTVFGAMINDEKIAE